MKTHVYLDSKSYQHRKCSPRKHSAIEGGFNLPQMIITISVIGILSAIAAPSISFGIDPLRDTSNRIKSHIKLTRTKAMSTTTAYRFKPVSNRKIEIQAHINQNGSSIYTCNDADKEFDSNGEPLWRTLSGFSTDDFTFAEGIELTKVVVNGNTVANPVDWSLCFNSRGISNQSVDLELTKALNGETKRLRVLLGGGISD